MSRIVLRDAGKRYVKYEDTPMLVDALRVRARTRRGQLWAVRHVDLEVADGECIGVIGRNGSGKSTLLRMVAGVTGPTAGSVEVRGRVSPLLSVGVGFHPELTGRENVYVNGTVLGLARREIDRRFDEIIDFAGIEEFVDTPLKFYSSGMFVRLGFAAAVAADPDILLVDEVLAVGDLAFQLKCFERMQEIRRQGTTIVVVNHNLAAVRQLCRRSLVLEGGTVQFLGPTDYAIGAYHGVLGAEGHTGSTAAVVDVGRLRLLGPDGTSTTHVRAGDEVSFVADVSFAATTEDPIFGFALATAEGAPVYFDSTPWKDTGSVEPGATRVAAAMCLPLATGSYTAQLTVATRVEGSIPQLSPPLVFYVTGRNRVTGIIDLEADFRVGPAQPSAAEAPAADPAAADPAADLR